MLYKVFIVRLFGNLGGMADKKTAAKTIRTSNVVLLKELIKPTPKERD